MRDVYIQLGHGRPRCFQRQVAYPRGVAFVDLADGAELSMLRDVEPTMLQAASKTVVRTTHPAALAAQASDLQSLVGPRVYHLEQKLGSPPRLVAVEGPGLAAGALSPEDDKALGFRMRRVELVAMLTWGEAFWSGENHHYLLPSGQHAPFFVNVASAVQRPRDAHVLASWLLPFAADGVAMLCDTGKLTPIVAALEVAVVRAGGSLGRCETLTDYPRSALDVGTALRGLAPRGPLLALLSVSSSGRLRGLVDQAFRDNTEFLAPHPWHVVTLVDLGGDRPLGPRHETWCGLGDVAPGRCYERHDRDCPQCRSNDRALLVPIDAKAMAPVLDGLIERVMPDLDDPRRNRDFWNLCSGTEAVEVERPPAAALVPFRPSRERLAIRVDFERLLASPALAATASSAFERRVRDERCALQPGDLALVPASDLERSGTEALLRGLPSVLAANAQVVGYPLAGEIEDESAKEKIRSAQIITVFTLGAISGHSMQKGLTTVQRLRRDEAYEVQGLVLHARTDTHREWTTLCNSFNKKLWAVWRSHHSTRSPLREELQLLGRAVDVGALPSAVQEFHSERAQLCQGNRGGALFWGAGVEDRLSPHSVYGEGISQRATYAAVSSALEAKRGGEVPRRRVFALRDLIRSYYDPLILAAFLRWLQPHECWWGRRPDEAESIVSEILLREQSKGSRRLLCSELLLASALGKVPATAVGSALVPVCRRLEQESPHPAIHLGLHLMDQLRLL